MKMDFNKSTILFVKVCRLSKKGRLIMTFETFRFMLQAYADQQKKPSSLPATVDTMAYAYQRICQGEDPWTALGDFSNAWYGYAKHIRPDLIKDPLTRPAWEKESSLYGA
jgi:hypothetical protein